MTPPTILIVLLVTTLWVIAVTTFRLRNWRAMALVSTGTVAMFGAGLGPWPVAQVAQAGLWLTIMWVLLFRNDLVAVMSAPEYDFVEKYVSSLQRIARLKRDIRSIDPGTYLREFESATASIERLQAPLDWRRLQLDTATELRRRLARMKLLAEPSLEEQEAAEEHWRQIEKRFNHMLKLQAGFWKDWPLSRKSE